MYNRYTPQPDGSYHRNRMPEQSSRHQPNRPTPPEKAHSHTPEPEHCPPSPPQFQISAGSFLKNLLPQDFDTGDLLIVLLLLLMAGSEKENSADALLTLALYFFM